LDTREIFRFVKKGFFLEMPGAVFLLGSIEVTHFAVEQ
jgi:hypothetical protein